MKTIWVYIITAIAALMSGRYLIGDGRRAPPKNGPGVVHSPGPPTLKVFLRPG
jgi:hypothetical protein